MLIDFLTYIFFLLKMALYEMAKEKGKDERCKEKKSEEIIDQSMELNGQHVWERWE